MSATKTFFAALSASDFYFICNFNAPCSDALAGEFALPALGNPPYYCWNDQAGNDFLNNNLQQ